MKKYLLKIGAFALAMVVCLSAFAGCSTDKGGETKKGKLKVCILKYI